MSLTILDGSPSTADGNDRIVGSVVDDIIVGAAGADYLTGDLGDDRLNGGEGADMMVGGAGADKYVEDDIEDVIVDFDLTADRILLDDAIFVTLAPGNLSQSAFAITRTATDAFQSVFYNPTTGLLAYDPDGMDGAAPIVFARLDPGLALTAEHFLVI